MYRVSEKAVLFAPPETIEPAALKQIENTASMPFVFKHVAVMPDCHYGKGATIGTVLATKGSIIPAAVGVDIGCGMIAVKTPLTRDDIADPAAIRAGIERRIPMSAGNNNRTLSESASRRVKELESLARRDYNAIDPNWRLQLGTLGGGNHFIELATDESNTVWATLHSGSRGIGNKIGNLHIRRAQAHCEGTRHHLPDRDLAYLTEGTQRVRRVCSRCAVGAEFRAAESRRNDGPRDARAEPECLRRCVSRRRARGAAHQLPSQLHAARRAFRRAHLGDAQRRHRGAPRHVGDDSRIDGHAQLHRHRTRAPDGVQLCSSRRRAAGSRGPRRESSTR